MSNIEDILKALQEQAQQRAKEKQQLSEQQLDALKHLVINGGVPDQRYEWVRHRVVSPSKDNAKIDPLGVIRALLDVKELIDSIEGLAELAQFAGLREALEALHDYVIKKLRAAYNDGYTAGVREGKLQEQHNQQELKRFNHILQRRGLTEPFEPTADTMKALRETLAKR